MAKSYQLSNFFENRSKHFDADVYIVDRPDNSVIMVTGLRCGVVRDFAAERGPVTLL